MTRSTDPDEPTPCPTGQPCLREQETGHPCDRDENGSRSTACERPVIFEAEDGSLRMRADVFVAWALRNPGLWGEVDE